MAAQAFDSSIQETEASGSLQPVWSKERVPAQPRLQKETLNKKQNKTKKKRKQTNKKKISFRIFGFQSQAVPVAFKPTKLPVLTEHIFFL